jgi:Zn-dependent peptidase ImmA (M78 family)
MQYNEKGRPILSGNDLAGIADSVLRKYAPECIESPRFVPIMDILEQVASKTNVSYCFTDLGEIDGHPVLGETRIAEKAILLDESLASADASRLRFVAAHELGHWILHRWRKMQLESISDFLVSRDSRNAFRSVARRALETEREWIEYQANTFASSLVMPPHALLKAIIMKQISDGIRRNVGIVYQGKSGGQMDTFRMIEALSEVFQVSMTQMKIRLLRIGLLQFQSTVNQEDYFVS